MQCAADRKAREPSAAARQAREPSAAARQDRGPSATARQTRLGRKMVKNENRYRIMVSSTIGR